MDTILALLSTSSKVGCLDAHPVSAVLATTILTPAIRLFVAPTFSDRRPVALANLYSARHKQSENFGCQPVVGIMVGCSALELMVHSGLHRLLRGSYACDVVGVRAGGDSVT
jgi:hypothetical protein